MNDRITQEINKIEISKEVRSRNQLGIEKAKLESPKLKRKWMLVSASAIIAMI